MRWRTELCPWCEQLHPARLTRAAGECREWQCAGCARRWTQKDSAPGELFAFWPGDLAAAYTPGSPTHGCCPEHPCSGTPCPETSSGAPCPDPACGREVRIEVRLHPSGFTLVVSFPQADA
jgi:hypothetical protein